MHNILLPVDENIKLALADLCADIPVAFPTETVYGLGGNAYSDNAVTKVFKYKDRSLTNPVSVFYKNIEHIAEDLHIGDNAAAIIKCFLPGPITVALKRKKNSRISQLCSAGADTVGVRISSHPIVMKLLSMLPFPLTAPSANRSNTFSPTTAQLVSEQMKEVASLMILDGGSCSVGMESTVIDCSGEIPVLVRLGAIPVDEIMERCGIAVDTHDYFENTMIKNYQSSKNVIINVKEAGNFDALLAYGTPFENNCSHVLNLSSTSNLNEAAANFFAMLSALEKTDAENICVMPIPNEGVGAAINNRLMKAVGSNLSSATISDLRKNTIF